MRKTWLWALRILAALLAAAAVIGWLNREEIARLHAVNTLFEPEKIVANFSGMNQAFLSRPVPRGTADVSALTSGRPMPLTSDVSDWVEARAVTSLLVLHEGKTRHESYYLGTGQDDLRISWSIAKSFLSALLGVLIEDGTIDSLDVPVTRYAPALTGSAYDGANLRDVVQMASGVSFNEDYKDYHSDINRMGRVLALGGSMDGFAANLDQRAGPPGELWRYVSIDTHVIGMVIRGATGRDIPDLLSEKIIAPLGLEAEPYFLTDGNGVAFVLGGLNLTSRDYARFGVMIEQNGLLDGRQIVPADWVSASTRASAPTEPGQTHYGYQWWVPEDASPGEFFGRGVYGQYLYIDQSRDIVIVVTAADRQFTTPGRHLENLTVLRKLSQAASE